MTEIPALVSFYMGIDPGAAGGLASVYENGLAGAIKMPSTEHDIAHWFKDIKREGLAFTLIEKAQSFPGQGVSSTFKYGCNYGFLRACLISNDIPFEEISPRKWQSITGCGKKAKNQSKREWKNQLRGRAQQLFPLAKPTLATADALLIAEACRRIHGEVLTRGG